MAKTPGDAAQEVAEAAAEKAQEVAEKSETLTPDALADVLAVGKGFRLADVDTRGTPGFDGDKAAGKAALAAGAERLSGLQERLFAEGSAGGTRSVLLVVQGMDTSGKGGIMRHVVGSVDPQGVHLRSFKAPTEEELAHDFLWRIEKALPRPGSHRRLRPLALRGRADRAGPLAWSRPSTSRGALRADQRLRAPAGRAAAPRWSRSTLHISKDEQKERLAERLDRPDKYWKYNPGDVDERLLWDDYQEAYQLALTRVLDPGRALARRPRRPQVVRPVGRAAAAARRPHRPRPAVARGRLRRRGREGAARGQLRSVRPHARAGPPAAR